MKTIILGGEVFIERWSFGRGPGTLGVSMRSLRGRTGLVLCVALFGCSVALDFDIRQLPPGTADAGLGPVDRPVVTPDVQTPPPDVQAPVDTGPSVCMPMCHMSQICQGGRCGCAAGLRLCNGGGPTGTCRECCMDTDCGSGRRCRREVCEDDD